MGLTLPYQDGLDTIGTVFEIDQQNASGGGSGGTAIVGKSFGVDSSGFGGFGVVGITDAGTGVEGYSDAGAGVWGFGMDGMWAWGSGGDGVVAHTQGGNGVVATTSGRGNGVAAAAFGGGFGVVADGSTGVFGRSTLPSAANAGVVGVNTGGGLGVRGHVFATPRRDSVGIGVLGTNSALGPGVRGESRQHNGVEGQGLSSEGTGVIGFNTDDSAHGILGCFLGGDDNIPTAVFGAQYDRTGWAGYFAGNVYVAGILEKAFNFFKIDHPLDPANKLLRHSVVESSEMKNLYDGTATLDARGEAVVELPHWFEALNRDFRYQLTAIGAASPNLHVAKAISKGRFSIAGGMPGGAVCWQVTGTRHDAAALAHPLIVEEEKAQHERGSFLNPSAQRADDDKGVEHRMRSRIKPHPAVPDLVAPAAADTARPRAAYYAPDGKKKAASRD